MKGDIRQKLVGITLLPPPKISKISMDPEGLHKSGLLINLLYEGTLLRSNGKHKRDYQRGSSVAEIFSPA